VCVHVCVVLGVSGGGWGWQDLQKVSPHVQALVQKGGERAPEVRGWVEDMVDDGIGGGGSGVGEVPVKAQICKVGSVSNVLIGGAG
jgi:hypothetical protein